MGSESSPHILFESVLKAYQQLDGTDLIVFATPQVVDSLLTSFNPASFSSKAPARIQFQRVSEVIEMADAPLTSIRQKKNSSLVVGIKFLRKRQIDAFVSAGNTGALIASAALSLPLLPGIRRPALLATLPTKKGYVAVIDVGGNVSCKAQHLVQFAQIAAAYQRCAQGIAVPKVGLLNIGVESKKGSSELQQAYQTLQGLVSDRMQFIGNIEGRELFQGKADVLVTDGFTGNVLLKTSEGIVFFILDHLKETLKDAPEAIRKAVLKGLQDQFDCEEYPGAIICGVDRVAVKCHGKTSVKGFFNGILGAADLVRQGFTEQIKHQLHEGAPAHSQKH